MHMAKKPSKITALGLLKSASGLTIPEFSKVLGMETRRVQSYILGTVNLPPLEELSNLETYFGVDLESLKTKKPKMISGREVTPELLKGWRTHGGISQEAAALACEQMIPTLTATITTLAQENRPKALLLIHRVQSLVQAELRRAIFAEKVKSAVESCVLSKSSERYASGAEMLKECQGLPTDHPRWAAFVARLNRHIPVTVERVSRPAYGVPIDAVEVMHEKKKSVGFRSTRIIMNEVLITQAGKSHRFLGEKSDQKVSTVSA
jgi:hypothetical protein